MAVGAYAIPITVDNTKVGESSSNFLYQCDLSSKLASDAVFKSHITTASNVAVWCPVCKSKKPRKVVLDLASNVLLVYWDGSTSTSTTQTFWICVGKNLNEVDSASAFTNSSVTNFWGFDETGTGSTTADFAGSVTGTFVSPTNILTGGQFYNCAGVSSGSNRGITTTSPIITTGNHTVCLMVRTHSTTGRQIIMHNGRFLVYTNNTTNNKTDITVYSDATANITTSTETGLNTWALVVITRTNTGATKIYINGVERASGSTGTPQTGTQNLVMTTLAGATFPYEGRIDNVTISNDIKSVGYITTRYNMLMDPSNFFVVGTGFSLGRPAILWNKVKQRLRAGFK